MGLIFCRDVFPELQLSSRFLALRLKRRIFVKEPGVFHTKSVSISEHFPEGRNALDQALQESHELHCGE